MLARITLLALAVLAAACSSPLIVQVERAEDGRKPTVREIEFEDHRLTEREDGSVGVWMEHRETFMPWHLVRHYLGEKMGFAYPATVTAGEPVAVQSGYYELRAQAPISEVTLRSGTVTPHTGEEGSAESFELVFDAVDAHGRAVTLTFRGQLTR